MRNDIKLRAVAVVGIDLGKNTFHVHGVDASGHVALKKQVTRKGLVQLMSNLPDCLVGMEACGGSHDWARRLTAMGHDVRLMGAQFVKAYVKSNKNDYADAEAICEAVQRPNMRFVPIKGLEQQDVQSIHRARSLAVSHRTAQANQIRGLLAEYGIVLPQGMASLRGRVPDILADADNGLTIMFRDLIAELMDEIRRLDDRVSGYDRQIKHLAQASDACQRLMTIPGIGAMTATALVAAVADAKVFGNGREMAAWIGLVPRQFSTGGKAKLLGISKRGDSYLRTLLIQGAQAVLRHAEKKPDRRSQWLCNLAARRGRNVAAIALANKNMRTAWALLTKHETYRPAMA
ncbi:MAG: IS110 family transposase [Mariprofundaceae bacterium]